ncbi:tyrosine-type recombinase/integrase [Pseudonocardia sp. P1]|uniref:tyrosine-type recombinase/integrase n=1 Tax=Pseudonocardia sp. P1 TaxID=761194 RepID=UPI003FD2370A
MTPHQWRHPLGTRLIKRDVPQEVVRRILDHDSPQMTAHYVSSDYRKRTLRRHLDATIAEALHGAARRGPEARS